MYLIFLMYGLLASTFSIGKLLVCMLPPVFLIASRMTIAGMFLLIFWYIFSREKNILWKNQDIGLLSAIVLFHILLPFICEYIALQYICPSSACLMYNLSPFFSAFFSYFIFQEHMTLKKWIGFSIGIAGILLYLQFQSSFNIEYSWYQFLMLASVITSSIGWILVRLLIKHRGYSTLFINGFSMFIGGIIALPISIYMQEVVCVQTIEIPYIIGLMALMILIANIIFYNMYGYLLTKYTATFLSFVGFITPLFAAFFEWIFFGTVVTQEFFIAVAIVGIGIFIFYQEELKQGYIA